MTAQRSHFIVLHIIYTNWTLLLIKISIASFLSSLILPVSRLKPWSYESSIELVSKSWTHTEENKNH